MSEILRLFSNTDISRRPFQELYTYAASYARRLRQTAGRVFCRLAPPLSLAKEHQNFEAACQLRRVALHRRVVTEHGLTVSPHLQEAIDRSEVQAVRTLLKNPTGRELAAIYLSCRKPDAPQP